MSCSSPYDERVCTAQRNEVPLRHFSRATLGSMIVPLCACRAGRCSPCATSPACCVRRRPRRKRTGMWHRSRSICAAVAPSTFGCWSCASCLWLPSCRLPAKTTDRGALVFESNESFRLAHMARCLQHINVSSGMRSQPAISRDSTIHTCVQGVQQVPSNSRCRLGTIICTGYDERQRLCCLPPIQHTLCQLHVHQPAVPHGCLGCRTLGV